MPRITPRLADLAQAFDAGRIDKWEFYKETRGYSVAAIAAASGIEPDVIRMRRRDLRRMTPPKTKPPATQDLTAWGLIEDRSHGADSEGQVMVTWRGRTTMMMLMTSLMMSDPEGYMTALATVIDAVAARKMFDVPDA
jgi:hypothetical protein